MGLRTTLTSGENNKIVTIIALFALLPLVIQGNIYYSRVFGVMITFILFAIALNIVFGHTDQLFLFTGALSGVTGYATVIIASDFGISVWLSLVVGIAVSSFVGATVSYVGATLEFDIIIISIFTFSLQLAFIQYVIGARELTGGTTGRPVPNVGLGNFELLYVLVLLLFGYLVLYDRLISSDYGLAFEAIRTDNLAAKSIGIEVVKYKIIAGGLSAAMIGLVGGILTMFEGFVTPSLFTFLAVDVLVLTMLVFGGLRTLEGPVVGGISIFWIDELLTGIRGLRLIGFGLIIIVLFLYFRQGIVPYLYDLSNELKQRTGIGETVSEGD
jgi:branched-chain amino acid transport system permease protein